MPSSIIFFNENILPRSHRQGVELFPLKKTQILIVESLHFEFLILYFLHFLSGREVQCSPTFCVCVCKAAKGQGLQCWIKKFCVAAPSTTRNSCRVHERSKRQLNLDKNLSEIAIHFVDDEAAVCEFKKLNS